MMWDTNVSHILNFTDQFSSVAQSCPNLWDPLWTAAWQASLSITNSWSLLRLMSIKSVIPSISYSVVSFSSRLQSFPASGSFAMSQFFTPGGQSIGVSASASVLPMNIQDNEYIKMDLLNLLAVQGTLKSFLQHHILKSINSLALSFLYSPTLTSIHDYWKNQLWLNGPLLQSNVPAF